MFKVPKNTSVWKTNDASPKGVMTFAPELIDFIKQNKKTQTYRLVDEKYQALKIGDTVWIKQNKIEEPIGQGLITNKVKVTFKDLPLSSPGHETPKNKEHQREVFSGYYAFLERKIQDSDEFFILDFKLLRGVK